MTKPEIKSLEELQNLIGKNAMVEGKSAKINGVNVYIGKDGVSSVQVHLQGFGRYYNINWLDIKG